MKKKNGLCRLVSFSSCDASPVARSWSLRKKRALGQRTTHERCRTTGRHIDRTLHTHLVWQKSLMLLQC